MNPPCKKNEIVWLEWLDAQSTWERMQLDNPQNIGLATNGNWGWIKHEDEKRVVLCNGLSTTGEHDTMVIPTQNVVARYYPFKTKKRCNVRTGE